MELFQRVLEVIKIVNNISFKKPLSSRARTTLGLSKAEIIMLLKRLETNQFSKGG